MARGLRLELASQAVAGGLDRLASESGSAAFPIGVALLYQLGQRAAHRVIEERGWLRARRHHQRARPAVL